MKATKGVKLILVGGIQINLKKPIEDMFLPIQNSIDEKGEMLYSITDKLELVNPEIYAELTEQYKHHMFQMIKQ